MIVLSDGERLGNERVCSKMKGLKDWKIALCMPYKIPKIVVSKYIFQNLKVKWKLKNLGLGEQH